MDQISSSPDVLDKSSKVNVLVSLSFSFPSFFLACVRDFNFKSFKAPLVLPSVNW